MSRLVLGLLLVALFVAPVRAADGDELAGLRRQAARGCFAAEPQLRLARFHHDRGRRLLAFSIVEHARRDGLDGFEAAFRRVFLDQEPVDTSADAEQAVRQRLAGSPEDAAVHRELADLLLWRRDFAGAVPVLQRAAELAPGDFSLHADLSQSLLQLGEPERGRKVLDEFTKQNPDSPPSIASRVQALAGQDPVAAIAMLERGLEANPAAGSLWGLRAFLLERQGQAEEAVSSLRRAARLDPDNPGFHAALAAVDAERDPSAALEHYLTTYFLDPTYRLEAPVSDRVRESAGRAGAERYRVARSACADGSCLGELLRDDDPVVVTLALKEVDASWSDELAPALVALMASDDPEQRAQATSVLRRHVGPDFAPQLRELLGDPDLRRRGLAAFLAVRVSGDEVLPVLVTFLQSDVELLRRNAIRALGSARTPAAKDLLREHRAVEAHPRLQQLIDQILG